ncbi:unnamed protein product, partial [Sphacelaria rigidula]
MLQDSIDILRLNGEQSRERERTQARGVAEIERRDSEEELASEDDLDDDICDDNDEVDDDTTCYDEHEMDDDICDDNREVDDDEDDEEDGICDDHLIHDEADIDDDICDDIREEESDEEDEEEGDSDCKQERGSEETHEEHSRDMYFARPLLGPSSSSSSESVGRGSQPTIAGSVHGVGGRVMRENSSGSAGVNHDRRRATPGDLGEKWKGL